MKYAYLKLKNTFYFFIRLNRYIIIILIYFIKKLSFYCFEKNKLNDIIVL